MEGSFNMPKGFFITGTDTGVGKTIVAGAMIRAIGMLGLRACGMKPIETGALRQGDFLIPPDGVFLKSIAKMDESINHITPYCLEASLAPIVAAEMENIKIEIKKIEKEFYELVNKYEAIVVEGVGGLLVPIKTDYYVIDLVRDLALPLIVVSRPTIGTINHTLLTVNYALREGIEVAGVIINYSRPPEGTLPEETNPQLLKRLSPVPLIGVFPHLKDMSDEALDRAVIRNLDMSAIRGSLRLEG